jgi:hypothetical protein
MINILIINEQHGFCSIKIISVLLLQNINHAAEYKYEVFSELSNLASVEMGLLKIMGIYKKLHKIKNGVIRFPACLIQG